MKAKIITGTTAAMLLVCLTAMAQISFEKTADWQQIRAKAKAEHKFIFVDCYATWCVPCKWMDEHVYKDPKVGDVFNKAFIAVKLQMDKTPKDDQLVKDRYYMASMLGRNYHIDAYPTLLFFDPDGQAVHKATGSMEFKEFIQLAADAKDSSKQYYTLLHNFVPGKLDIAEEKALAGTFFYTDKALATRLAADYLTRTPDDQLSLDENVRLMNRFQNDAEVAQLIDAYLTRMSSRPNTNILTAFQKQAVAKQIAHSYINKLPLDSLYLKKNLQLMSVFTESAGERGFDVFYKHEEKVDMVMQRKGFARSTSESILSRSLVEPFIASAKDRNATPDFEQLKKQVSAYDEDMTDRLMTGAKLGWYKYLVLTKKDTAFWPQMIDAQIARIGVTHSDTDPNLSFVFNNICYAYIFLHGANRAQFDTAASWMSFIVSKYPNKTDYLDTYASVLYRDGQVDLALKWEEKALRLVRENKSAEQTDMFSKKITDMKNGVPIWLKKEYQD